MTFIAFYVLRNKEETVNFGIMACSPQAQLFEATFYLSELISLFDISWVLEFSKLNLKYMDHISLCENIF